MALKSKARVSRSPVSANQCKLSLKSIEFDFSFHLIHILPFFLYFFSVFKLLEMTGEISHIFHVTAVSQTELFLR